MISIAIVEDNRSEAKLLNEYIERYGKENGIAFEVNVFADAVLFLTNYRPRYDIVFMDIEMPDMDGMQASVRLREVDASVTLIFVTNMAQYAVKGYEVDALDFIVKPVSYSIFSPKMAKAIRNTSDKRGKTMISVNTEKGMTMLPANELCYVEVMRHRLIYHTDVGEIVSGGSLKEAEEKLADMPFSKCNSCYLVNLRFVRAVEGDTVTVGKDKLQISRRRKKQFLDDIAVYMGGGSICR